MLTEKFARNEKVLDFCVQKYSCVAEYCAPLVLGCEHCAEQISKTKRSRFIGFTFVPDIPFLFNTVDLVCTVVVLRCNETLHKLLFFTCLLL
jgi:hypothetical protein